MVDTTKLSKSKHITDTQCQGTNGSQPHLCTMSSAFSAVTLVSILPSCSSERGCSWLPGRLMFCAPATKSIADWDLVTKHSPASPCQCAACSSFRSCRAGSAVSAGASHTIHCMVVNWLSLKSGRPAESAAHMSVACLPTDCVPSTTSPEAVRRARALSSRQEASLDGTPRS